MIREVQSTLRQNGDYSGGVDGVWGPMTESGVRKWQQAHNMGPTGEIDVATLQSMNLPAGNQGQANATQPTGEQTNQAAGSTTQPSGNPNYSTSGNQQAGGSYSFAANPNTQAPNAQGTTMNNNTSTPASGTYLLLIETAPCLGPDGVKRSPLDA